MRVRWKARKSEKRKEDTREIIFSFTHSILLCALYRTHLHTLTRKNTRAQEKSKRNERNIDDPFCAIVLVVLRECLREFRAICS